MTFLKLITGVFTALIIFFFPIQVLAHFRGVPIIKINNNFTQIYTKEEFASFGQEAIPSDIGSENYLVNKPLIFEVDPTKLPYPDEVTSQASFKWDFGDGKTSEGVKVEHSYNKIGSYEVKLEINFGDLSKFNFYQEDQASLIQQQNVLIHIVPSAEYKIPQPKILINGQELDGSKDSLSLKVFDSFLFFRLAKNLTLDASQTPASGKIVSYEWDLGGYFDDKKMKKGVKINTSFTDDYYIYDLGLKVIDENGLKNYKFFNLVNEDKGFSKGDGDNRPIVSSGLIYTLAGSVISLILLAILGFYFFFRSDDVKKPLSKKHKIAKDKSKDNTEEEGEE